MLQIENKYNIGDRVYFLDKKHKCQSMVVKSMALFVYADHISYSYYGDDPYTSYPEESLFATEKDLKDYIFNPPLQEFV